MEKEIGNLLEQYQSGIWYKYEDIYKHVGIVYKKIKGFRKTPVFVSIGRGGWIVSRILASFFEKDELPHHTFTVTTSYTNRNSPLERPAFVQKLDESSIKTINCLVGNGAQLWLLDVPYVTGGTMRFVKAYLEKKFKTYCSMVVLHVVSFREIAAYPWRKTPLAKPDVYALKIKSDKGNWYVQYPWEWTNLEAYGIVCDAFQKKLSLEALRPRLLNL